MLGKILGNAAQLRCADYEEDFLDSLTEQNSSKGCAAIVRCCLYFIFERSILMKKKIIAIALAAALLSTV